jgi:hypothetical protein
VIVTDDVLFEMNFALRFESVSQCVLNVPRIENFVLATFLEEEVAEITVRIVRLVVVVAVVVVAVAVAVVVVFVFVAVFGFVVEADVEFSLLDVLACRQCFELPVVGFANVFVFEPAVLCLVLQ